MTPLKFIAGFWKRYKIIILLLAAWRVALEMVNIAASAFIPQHPGYIGTINWSNFDGIHYLRIAQVGYYNYVQAFFPLYPLLIRLLTVFFPFFDPAVTSSLASFILFGVGLIIFYRVLMDVDNPQPLLTVILVLVFPVSFFHTAVYTEGLFLCLTVGSYFLALRKKWWGSVVLGFLAALTKVYGFLILIPIVYEYLAVNSKRTKIGDLIKFTMPLLGLAAYMIYLYFKFGDPLAFFHVQSAFGANRSGSEIILPPQTVWRYLKIIFTAYLQPTPVSYFVSILELVSGLAAAGLLYFGFRIKFNPGLLAYTALLLLVPTLTGTLSSFPRYLLSAFPVYMLGVEFMVQKKAYYLILVFMVMQIILSALFLRGYFVG